MVREGDCAASDVGGENTADKSVLTPSSRVVAVAASAVADKDWKAIVAKAKKSAPTPRGRSKYVEKERRKRRDAEIVGSEEYELPAEDKVVLLVSCSLNDRTDLPGHMFRCLVREHRARAEARRRDKEIIEMIGIGVKLEVGGNDKQKDVAIPNLPQSRDARFVIQHVIATLREARPGFGISSRLEKKMATAVEALVFGELYDDVFAEIVEETRKMDDALMKKIGSYEIERLHRIGTGKAMACSKRKIQGEDVSVEALEALLRLPEARVPSEKLSFCVSFIESISSHFFGKSNDREHLDGKENQLANRSIGADSLLKMVCEHIIVAKVPHLNAELMFLEEFSTDEHALKGKEGYTLVTLQSSLQFLNASDDIERDIIIDSN